MKSLNVLWYFICMQLLYPLNPPVPDSNIDNNSSSSRLMEESHQIPVILKSFSISYSWRLIDKLKYFFSNWLSFYFNSIITFSMDFLKKQRQKIWPLSKNIGWETSILSWVIIIERILSEDNLIHIFSPTTTVINPKYRR